MAIVDRKQVEAGAALYSPWFLAVYDWLALGLFSTIVWRCPACRLLRWVNQNITSNHLDIGVGTGYFLDACRFPLPVSRLALLDLNQNALGMTSRRLARYRPEVYRGNALEPFQVGEPGFDSVGIMNLLHCLPGDMSSKEIIFKHILDVLNPDGVVFGSTIIGNGPGYNIPARLSLRVTNRAGFMSNYQDTVEELEAALSRNFFDHTIEVVGCQALFRAVK